MCQTGINCPNCAWAAANGYRLRPTLMFNPKIRSGVPLGGYRTALVKLSDENTVDRSVRSVNKTKQSKSIKEQPSNKETIIKKPVKQPQTQSERSKARKMKRRQLQQDELAAKRANINSSTPTTEDVKIGIPKVETGVAPETGEPPTVAVIRTVNQKKKPKTHFRKTKKPGRA